MVAGFTVDADAYFHLVVRQIEGGPAVRGNSAGGQRHAHGAAVPANPLGKSGDLGKASSLLGGGPGHLLHDDRHTHATATGGVERILNSHVILDDDSDNWDTGVHFNEFGGHLEIHDVAGVILHDVEDAGPAIDGGGGGSDLVGNGRGEDLARAGGVQHACADEAAVKGLVPAAASGDDGDLAVLLGSSAVDDAPIDIDSKRIRMCRGHAGQGFRDDGISGIDELLHASMLRLMIPQSQ